MTIPDFVWREGRLFVESYVYGFLVAIGFGARTITNTNWIIIVTSLGVMMKHSEDACVDCGAILLFGIIGTAVNYLWCLVHLLDRGWCLHKSQKPITVFPL